MAELIEINNERQRPLAVLCGVDTGAFDMQRSMDELESLAETAGATPHPTPSRRGNTEMIP